MAHGQFVWYELLTTDTAAAKRFYGDVVGWTPQDMPMPGMTYTLLTRDGVPLAGMMDVKAVNGMSPPPSWTGYVSVADVDASAKQAESLGGKIFLPPMDIPTVGRFAVIADPQDAVIALFKPLDSGQQMPTVPPETPGRVMWHELYATDSQKVFEFYAAMFGWKKAEAMDMGAMGTYQLFSAGGDAIGGMMDRPAEAPANFWKYYFAVGLIDEAASHVTAGGGKILMGPMQVPGGAWVIQAIDPQGALFALLGRKS